MPIRQLFQEKKMKNTRKLLLIVLIFAMVTLACGIQINLPDQNIKTGPLQTETIEVNTPVSESINLTFEFGAGELMLSPNGNEFLVSGIATYNVLDLAPEIKEIGGEVTLSTGDLEINGFPNFKGDFRNEWDLKIADVPLNLIINAGAYKGSFDLGGLSIQSLDINDGASDVDLTFSKPNLVEMETLRYETGASRVKLEKLANANFISMTFRSGAGDYTLDFSGDLKQDAYVRIQSGVSRVTLILPEGRSAKVIFTGGISTIETDSLFQQDGNVYSLSGEGPTITIEVDMGAGSLQLRTE
jgi:hypothetical protein